MRHTPHLISGFLGAVLICLGVSSSSGADLGIEPIDIGSRRELFVDRWLIDALHGATLQLHEPTSAGTALQFDRPYEGVFAAYVTVIKDGQTYRMYYRGLRATKRGQADHSITVEVTCYAESPDGIRWAKPLLGLYEVEGSRDNNVILARSPACHNFSPFVDTRPGVEAAQRFKAVGGNQKEGLLAFVSADGVHFSKLRDEPIITGGAFDSQNLVFWSESEHCYVCYFRTFKSVGNENYRWISRTTSKDFLKWTEPVEMGMGDTAPVHFYTNQTHPYYRAPHLYVSFFARFVPGRQVLTKEAAVRLGVVGDYFHDVSDACFMTSRGGNRYDRTFPESFVRPGRGAANWTSRTNYPALGMVPTPDGMVSMYIQRNYATPSHHLERLTLRPDGFASVHAGFEGGECFTKPLVFTGKELTLNVSTSAAGEVRVEIQSADGTPMPGYALADCKAVIGDELERVVSWKHSSDLSALAGKPVRLRFVLKEADLYAIQFR
jgi:hypothetical protein